MDEVPGSDDEEYFLPAIPNPMQQTPPSPAPAALTESISSFPAVKPAAKDTISSSSSVAPPTRPKPRPTFKGAPAAARPTVPGDTSIIEPYSTNIGPSERAKMRIRGARKSTPEPITSSIRTTLSSEIIEIDDSGDELAMSPKNPRPKGSTSSSSSNGPRMPSPNQPAPQKSALPALFQFPSSLPPSDPFPHSTATTRYQPEHDQFVPPIATLTAAGDTSFDLGSSPSVRKEKSKPKLKPKSTQKPKPKPQTPKPAASDVDELVDGMDGEGSGQGRDTNMMLPPHIPDAFSVVPPLPPGAGPSAGPAPGTLVDGAAPAAPAGKPPKKSRKKQGADEGGEKPAKKPRAKKAKKDAEGGEEGGQEKPKKKGKGKEKEKEVFKSAEFINDDDDDLVPPFHGAPLLAPDSGMDVGVPAAGPSGGKPVSVISIPDSQPDEELAPIIGEKRKRVDEEDENSANVTNNGTAKAPEKKSEKAKTATQAGDKTKKKGPAKKAKGRTVMSDEEDGPGDEADAMVVDLEGPSAPPPQSESDAGEETREEIVKPAKKKKAKKAVVSDSDAEGDETREETVKPAKKKAKKTVVSDSEGEGDDAFQNKPNENSPPHTGSKSQVENTINNKPASSPKKKNVEETPKPAVPSISSKYTIASRTKSTPLSELIRRVNSRPGSPFPVVVPRRSSLGGAAASTSASAGGSNPGTPTTTYSPYNKFSRSALSRIAPLHLNRRTPPPPLPPPPPKPKTKKEKEREERWEEEMIEAVGGWDEWKLLSEQEQKAAKRAKWARELEGWED